ncbi:aminoacyl-tRNA hydrolase [Rhodopirellula sallentina]|uniref:Peptidyl-tRNA hydrolase n=1 Tax=Rhodopirellula sallentina SM41 TaxID=1263870 RepID=M5TZV1_9BACT|nr:aminoacyl-tRNA hydrolase [Rhodopirellula sallentina]EMI54737.1 peptidyl-tRNA hydrolase [Rhodopirellula sallentina SM41]
MKLIVGLGNPGRKYEQTRHNVGFMVAEQLCREFSGSSPSKKFDGEISEIRIGSEKGLVLCPHTFMNASGKSIRKAFDFYKLNLEDLIVICDDLNLATGRIRIRRGGSAGGQKGLADTIAHLGTDQYPRLRIGIDRPPAKWQVVDYVLGNFNEEERPEIELAIMRSCDAIRCWATEGITEAMSRFNSNAA